MYSILLLQGGQRYNSIVIKDSLLFELRILNFMLFINTHMNLCVVLLILYPPMSSNVFSTITFMVVQDRKIPDCRDPPDTLLVGCVVSGQSGGSQTVGILRTLCSWAVLFQDSQEDPGLSGSSGHSARGLCHFRTVRRIPDCRDPPDTQL